MKQKMSFLLPCPLGWDDRLTRKCIWGFSPEDTLLEKLFFE